MFKRVNLLNKLISLLIFFLILIILKANTLVFLPAILTLTLILTNINKRNLIIALIFLFLSFFISNNMQLIIIYRVLIFIFFALALENSLTGADKRNFYSYLYNKKLIDNKAVIDRCYREDLNNTIEFDNSLLYKYINNKNEKIAYKKYLKQEKEKKLKRETKYKYLLDKLRYGSYHDKCKTTAYRFKWTNSDNLYIAIFIFGFLLSLVTRM